MNNLISRIVGLYLLAASTLIYASNMTAEDYANKYYKEFNKWHDDGTGYIFSLQTDVLDQMLERACAAKPKKDYLEIDCIFEYVKEIQPDLFLSRQFESNIYMLSKDSYHFARRDAIQLLGRLKRDKDHDLIVAALNDSNDEVRAVAIDALRDRPGSDVIYRKYMQDHQSDPAYRISVLYAKSGLEAIQEAKKGSDK
jgi:hypothetical protein